MSEGTRWHTTEWAKNRTNEEIAAEIEKLEKAPEWKGVEFDDQRMRNMARTRISTLRSILQARTTT